MNLRVDFVIDLDDNNNFFHLQSVKKSAQRTGACPKRRMPKSGPNRRISSLARRLVSPLRLNNPSVWIRPNSPKKEKKGKKHSGSVKSDAEEHIVQEEDIGESHERATEKELKRARKEARRQEKADRVASKDAAAVDSPDSVEKKKNKDEKKRKPESDEAVKKPKKRRTSTGVAQDIPNPEEDSELPEQARKGAFFLSCLDSQLGNT